jgi:hypothetical protein
MNFDWQLNGFEGLPVLKPATGKETLYRAWGGHPGRKWGNTDLPGVCFSLDKAKSRWHAEMLYAVMEYQNPVCYLTEFSIPEFTPIWVGKVHPGDPRAVLGEISGRQILIERSYVHLVRELQTTPLSNDLGLSFVHTSKEPRLSS